MPSLGGSAEIPCARCGRRVAGLGWGELCPLCRMEREGRASRLARRVALVATALVALYVMLRMPPQPLSRVYGAIVVLVTYVAVRRIVGRFAMEFLPR